MRVLFLLICFCVSSICPANKQEIIDTIKVTEVSKTEVKIELDILSILKKEKDSLSVANGSLVIEKNRLNARMKELESKLNRERDSLAILKKETEKIKAENVTLHNYLLESDKRLFNAVHNLLFLEYDAYSIDKIAIPAIKAIVGDEIRKKHQVEFDLVFTYKEDVKSVYEFIKYIEADKALKNPFQKDAKHLLSYLKEQSFYKGYTKYDHWNETYLGNIINKIENQLSKYDGRVNKLNLNELKENIEKALKTINTL